MALTAMAIGRDRVRVRSPWPTPKQMGDLVVAGPEPGRVLLGRLQPSTVETSALDFLQPGGGSPALASRPYQGVLVIGPARSGKTSSILVPAIRQWNGSVIATSIRSDLLAESREDREAAGWSTLIYNPTNQGGYGSNTWSPLATVTGERAWENARRVASALIEASSLAENGANAQATFWNAAAADYLGPLLLAAAQDGPSMEPVIRWLQEGGSARGEVGARLVNHAAALRAAVAVWESSVKLRDSIYLTARTALAAYQDSTVMSTCLGRNGGRSTDITPDSVLGTAPDPERGMVAGAGSTLYVISPPSGWRYFAPLFTALLTSLIDEAYRRADSAHGLAPPLLLALDEVANIAPINDLPAYSSTAAGAGIQLITVLQDLGQAERIWEVGGTVDLPTLEWVQAMLGEKKVKKTTRSRSGLFGQRSTSHSEEERPLATMAEIREMPTGTALLICGSAPAARLTLRQWTTI
jgi:type IV secretion system protein VirD4